MIPNWKPVCSDHKVVGPEIMPCNKSGDESPINVLTAVT